jgi:hypothetical protein
VENSRLEEKSYEETSEVTQFEFSWSRDTLDGHPCHQDHRGKMPKIMNGTLGIRDRNEELKESQ